MQENIEDPLDYFANLIQRRGLEDLYEEFKPSKQNRANSDVGCDNEELCRLYEERDEETEEKYLEKEFFKDYRMGTFCGVQFQRFPYLSTAI